MKLCVVSSTLPELLGHKDVDVTWIMDGRAQPLRPYEAAIVGYTDLAHSDRVYAECILDEMFTNDEARGVLAWLNEHKSGVHVLAGLTTMPLEGVCKDGEIAMIGLTNTCCGDGVDFIDLSAEPEWDLPFKVMGHYDLRHYEEVTCRGA